MRKKSCQKRIDYWRRGNEKCDVGNAQTETATNLQVSDGEDAFIAQSEKKFIMKDTFWCNKIASKVKIDRSWEKVIVIKVEKNYSRFLFYFPILKMFCYLNN